MAKVLVMTFLTDDKKKVNMNFDAPKDEIQDTDIKTAMDEIIKKDIFDLGGYKFIESVGAKVVTTVEKEFEF